MSIEADAIAIPASAALIAILMPCAIAAIGAPMPVDAVATSTAVTTALAPVKHQLMVSLCFLYSSLA